MDYEKLIERLRHDANAYRNGDTLGRAYADQRGCAGQCRRRPHRPALLAENKRLRAELERVKVERDAYQAYFKDLSSKPDCNTCEKRSCEYKPRPGAIVRVNCPLYSGPEKED
nr:MAG TPA: hypothetical protein [Caudoviricetes sp.]